MRLTTVASGSSGNCVYVGSDRTHVLVDAGISKKRTEEGLHSCDIDLKDISAIMITHEHIDHINGLGVISRKYSIPIMATPLTVQAIRENKKLGEIPEGLFMPMGNCLRKLPRTNHSWWEIWKSARFAFPMMLRTRWHTE